MRKIRNALILATKEVRGLIHDWVLLALVAAYFLAGRLGLHFASVHPSASAVWPPTGIALAAMLMLGRRTWPAILAGAFLVNYTTSGSILSSAGISVGNTLEALVAGTLVRRAIDDPSQFRHAEEPFAFILTCAAGAVIAACAQGVKRSNDDDDDRGTSSVGGGGVGGSVSATCNDGVLDEGEVQLKPGTYRLELKQQLSGWIIPIELRVR